MARMASPWILVTGLEARRRCNARHLGVRDLTPLTWQVEKNGRLVHLVRWEDGEDDEWLDMTTEVWQRDMEKNRGKSDKTLGGMLHTAITRASPSSYQALKQALFQGIRVSLDAFRSLSAECIPPHANRKPQILISRP